MDEDVMFSERCSLPGDDVAVVAAKTFGARYRHLVQLAIMMKRRLVAAWAAAMASVISTQAQEFVDLPWRQQGDVLEVRLLADDNGQGLPLDVWVPMYGVQGPRSLGEAILGRRPCGLMGILPLLVHGSGGAAYIEEAPKRVQKLAIPFIVSSGLLETVAPHPLEDLLRVRCLEGVVTAASSYALQAYQEDQRRSDFVRAAAHAVLSGRGWKRGAGGDGADAGGDRERLGASGVEAILGKLPSVFDLAMGMQVSAMPRLGTLLTAWRRVMLARASDAVLAGGGSLAPSQLCEIQLLADIPGQMPFDVARRFGNWRVDYAVVACRKLHDPHLWVYLQGEFSVGEIAGGLRSCGMNVKRDGDGGVEGSGGDWTVRAEPTAVTVQHRDFLGAENGAWAGRLRAGHEAVWFLIPRDSILGDGQVEIAGEIALDDATVACTVASEVGDVEVLVRRARQWIDGRHINMDSRVGLRDDIKWRDVVEGPAGTHERLRGQLAVRGLLRNVAISAGGNVVKVVASMRETTGDDMARILGMSAGEIWDNLKGD